MAEESHEKSGGSSVGMKEAGELIIGILVFLMIVSLIIYRYGGEGGATTLASNLRDGFLNFMHENAVGRFLGGLLFALKFAGTYLSLILILGIIAVVIKLTAVNKKEHHLFSKETVPVLSKEKKESQEWQRIQTHISGDNPSDWRLAILEADIMLDEMLEKKGYLGATLGEKLKNTNKGDFASLDKAWEVHKIRNLIAHEGANFLISEREAKRIIALFKDVFDEFHYIV